MGVLHYCGITWDGAMNTELTEMVHIRAREIAPFAMRYLVLMKMLLYFRVQNVLVYGAEVSNY
jgi:hypothetical protein